MRNSLTATILCAVVLTHSFIVYAESKPVLPSFARAMVCITTVKASDQTLASDRLFQMGVGSPGSAFKIYGKRGWLKRNEQFLYAFQVTHQKPAETFIVWPASGAGLNGCAEKGKPLITPFKTHKARYDLVFVTYKAHAKQSLSQDLQSYLIQFDDKDLRLYGHKGLLAVTKDFNQGIDYSAIPVGTELIVAIPAGKDLNKEASIAATQKTATIIAKPEIAPIEDIVALPQENQKQIPSDVIARKLNEEKIAKLDPETVAKIPNEVVEKKAWEYSLTDMNKPGMSELFKNMQLSSPGAYLGLRYGRVLVKPDGSFLSKLSIIGVLAEVRSGIFSGARLSYDLVPTVRSKVINNEGTYKLGYSKVLFGWAFGLPLTWIGATTHFIPRIGKYSVQISYALPAANSTYQTETVDIENALSAGMEADLEWSKFFYTFRLWGGIDKTPKTFAKNRAAESSRFGADIYLKGKGFSVSNRPLSIYYLLYTARELITVENKDQLNPEQINLLIPHAGLGLAITW